MTKLLIINTSTDGAAPLPWAAFSNAFPVWKGSPDSILISDTVLCILHKFCIISNVMQQAGYAAKYHYPATVLENWSLGCCGLQRIFLWYSDYDWSNCNCFRKMQYVPVGVPLALSSEKKLVMSKAAVKHEVVKFVYFNWPINLPPNLRKYLNT